MARYKPQEQHSLLLPVVLSEQIAPGSFAFVLNDFVDNELGLTAMDTRFNNDEVGASAYDPRVMLTFVCSLSEQIKPLFTQVLLPMIEQAEPYCTAKAVDCKACSLQGLCPKNPMKPNAKK